MNSTTANSQEMQAVTPSWYQDYLTSFLAAEAHAFILHKDIDGYAYESLSQRRFLISMLAKKRIVVCFDLARGITFPDEAMRTEALALLNTADAPVSEVDPFEKALAGIGSQDSDPDDPFATRKPLDAMRLLERVLRAQEGKGRVAVIIDYADKIMPPQETANMAADDRTLLVLLQGWGIDRSLGNCNNPIFLLTRDLDDLHSDIRTRMSGYKAIELALPDYEGRVAFLRYYLQRRDERRRTIPLVDITIEELARLTAGLNLKNLEDVLLLAAKAQGVTLELIKQAKDEIIATEYRGLVEIIDPLPKGFAAVGGMEKTIAWFKEEIITPIRSGAAGDIPKGILLVGPPGTGKTFLVRALAREIGFNAIALNTENILGGIVGTSERNLKTVLDLARSISPVALFVDEIDQSDMSKRGNNSGNPVASNLFSALLRFMGDATLRGKVIVFFASVSGETPVLVRRGGATRFAPIGEVVDAYFLDKDEEGNVVSPDLETLAVLPDHSVGWSHVQSVYRHRVSEVYDIHYGSEKTRITATGNHSVFVLDEEANIIPRLVSDLKAGDFLVIPTQSSGAREAEITISLVDRQTTEARERLESILVMAKVSSQSQVATRFGIGQSHVSQYVRRQTQPRGLGAAMPSPSTVLDEDFAWFLGLFTAEGYARKEVCITLSEQEQDLLQRAEAIMRAKFELPVNHRVANGAHHLIISSAPLARRLKELVGTNAHDKHIPSALWNAERSIALSYIKGWIDGDGTTNAVDKITLTTVSQSLAYQGVWFLRLNGIAASLDEVTTPERSLRSGQTIKATLAYRLHITGGENPWAERPRKLKNGARDKRVPVALLRTVYQRLKPHRTRSSSLPEYTYLSNPTHKSVSRTSARAILQSIYTNRRSDDPIYERMLPFVFGDLGVAPVLRVEPRSYQGFVYDFCGCDNECFIGGMSPVMLHNSNRPDLLDSALTRFGRIDDTIPIRLADEKGRYGIVQAQADLQGCTIEEDAAQHIARTSIKFSGADLEAVVAKARKLAKRRGSAIIALEDAERAMQHIRPETPKIADYYSLLAIQACKDTELLEPDEIALLEDPAGFKRRMREAKITVPANLAKSEPDEREERSE